jgi:hypothetical protein
MAGQFHDASLNAKVNRNNRRARLRDSLLNDWLPTLLLLSALLGALGWLYRDSVGRWPDLRSSTLMRKTK